jgi:CRP-like cAMP-binding protein
MLFSDGLTGPEMQTGFPYSSFANRLGSVAELSANDLDLLARMPFAIGHFKSHETILRKGDEPDCCRVLLQGYLCWRDTGKDEGQIISIYVPGDVPDLQTLGSPQVPANLSTLGPAVVAFVPHSFLREIAAHSPSMSHALSLLDLADAASLRNWIVNLGSRDSMRRVAHLICEIATRLRAIGQAKGYQFPSPFTQSDLAAACAISTVHANRIVQELRRTRLVNWQAKIISITDWDGLAHLAGFNPDYLRLRNSRPPEFHQHAETPAGLGAAPPRV